RGCAASNHDHRDPLSNQLSGQFRKPLVMVIRPAVVDRDVLILDESPLLEPFAKGSNAILVASGRRDTYPSDHRHRRLLRTRRNRPRRRAAEQRQERAPSHSITSSARASSVCGKSNPSALAVCKLMVKLNLVERSTGRSAAFTPFSILSTKAAAR